MALEITAEIIMGISTSPELVAELPLTPCTKRGMKRIEPNIPMPVRKVALATTANMGFLNSDMGSMGSEALFWLTRNTNQHNGGENEQTYYLKRGP